MSVSLGDEPLWYKDAIIYEVPVRAFRDHNGDGVGDFKGLVERLDYLQDLGVTALWLLPFYPSPLRDDGYDIADYTDVHPRYGTLADFKLFLNEAHRRNLRVITELVINHTSDQHPWFQRARRAAPGDPARDFYVWSDTSDRYTEARIIFKDFEASNWTWDPVAKSYYWHRFYSHQPDLNYDNPRVWEAVFGVLDFWLEMGIDGLRLDAIPYLYEREGTNCENLGETHIFLKALRKHVDEHFPNRMLLAEANQWPEDAVAYFGHGDECHMAFHFPVMPRLFMAIRMEDRLPILDILAQTPAIPENCQWALFLRNHDELTLEMVTDEDRDYMYRVYARDPQARINLGIRRRLAPLLENQRPKIELMNGLLYSLPGAPVLYYGDEIGMGDNIYLGDRNGVRTPMQWNGDRNAGFSRANPQSLYLPVIIDPEYHFEAVNVEVQQNNPHSLLWWTKRLIDMRKRHRAFSRGGITFLTPSNHKVLAFVRSYHGKEKTEGDGQKVEEATGRPLPAACEDDILVVANLSRFTQYAELDLAGYRGWRPVELMGRTPFPVIGDRPYMLTLGPYSFFWFALEKRRAEQLAPQTPAIRPTFEVAEKWEYILTGTGKDLLEEWLPLYLKGCPWFRNKYAQIEAAMILETIPVPGAAPSMTWMPGDRGAAREVHVALVQTEYSEGDPETYVLPMAYATGAEAARIRGERPQSVIAVLQVQPRPEPLRKADTTEAAAARRTAPPRPPETGILYDPVGDADFSRVLLDAIFRRRRFKRSAGELLALPLPGLKTGIGSPRAPGAVRENGEVQSAERKPEAAPTAVAAKAVLELAQPSAPLDPPLTVLDSPKTSVLENPAGPMVLRNYEHHNTSVLYGERYVLKLFRRVEEGINPEVELGRFLAEKAGFTHLARLLGLIEYRRGWGEPVTLATLHEFVPNQGDGWRYFLDALGRFFEQALVRQARAEAMPMPAGSLLSLAGTAVPTLVHELLATTLDAARLLGQRSGEMHLALASQQDDPAFAPEPFTSLYQRSLYQSLRSQARQTFALLRRSLEQLPAEVHAEAERLLEREEPLLQHIRAAYEHKIQAQRMRVHGDYDLREVLWTGRDFVIVDFEGMSSRPLSDRRRKYTPLRDVADMIRSFHYASLFALQNGGVRREDRPTLASWARGWYLWTAAAFLGAYLEAVRGSSFLPRTPEGMETLLDLYLVKRALNEMRYELPRNPAQAGIPIQGLLQMLDAQPLKVEEHKG